MPAVENLLVIKFQSVRHHWAENVAILPGKMISPTLCVFERLRWCDGWGMWGNRGEVGYLSFVIGYFKASPKIYMLLTHTHVVQFLPSAGHKRRFWGTFVTKQFWWPLTSIVLPKNTETFFKIYCIFFMLHKMKKVIMF